MNPEESNGNQEALLGSIESAVENYFPGFHPERSRVQDQSSGERGILEFYTSEGNDKTQNPVLYTLLKRPTGLTAYAQHLKPQEGKISLIGMTSYDFDDQGQEVPWKESDINMMLAKLKIFTDGVELNGDFLDQFGTWSPKIKRFLTIGERLLSAKALQNAEREPDTVETVNWDDADQEQRAIYEEEQRLILEQRYTQTLNGLSLRTLATRHPEMARLLTEQNIQKRGNTLSPTGEVIPAEVALDEIRSGSVMGTQLLRMELHRLDAYEEILRIRKPSLPNPQQSSEPAA